MKFIILLPIVTTLALACKPQTYDVSQVKEAEVTTPSTNEGCVIRDNSTVLCAVDGSQVIGAIDTRNEKIFGTTAQPGICI